MSLLQTFAQLDLSPLPSTAANQDSLNTILTIVFSVAGAVALLVVVYGGVRFIASRGQPAEFAKARSIIVYGIVGLVVVLLAFAIVSFTIGI